jgi:ubiquinone/menaquinone biosynthesis C-methylase UbiE
MEVLGVINKMIKSKLINKLNLGCGENILLNYINVDRIKLNGVDKVLDLEVTPLPFKDNSMNKIFASHVLEHIHNFMPLIEEIHRIAKPNSLLKIVVPYYKYEGTFRDPTHRGFFTEHSFDYFKDGVKFSHYSKVRFKVLRVKKRIKHYSDVKNKLKRIIAAIPNFMRPILDIFFWNMYTEIEFNLQVIK